MGTLVLSSPIVSEKLPLRTEAEIGSCNHRPVACSFWQPPDWAGDCGEALNYGAPRDRHFARPQQEIGVARPSEALVASREVS
jgi:hypothetical protein